MREVSDIKHTMTFVPGHSCDQLRQAFSHTHMPIAKQLPLNRAYHQYCGIVICACICGPMIIGADADAIRTSYKRLAQKWHPEKNPKSDEAFSVSVNIYCRGTVAVGAAFSFLLAVTNYSFHKCLVLPH